MPDIRRIAAETHGRYLVAPAASPSAPLLVGFHGYMENAAVHLAMLEQVASGRAWTLVSVQALNRFYTRQDAIAAGWMTREDRELAIADNRAYVTRVVAAVRAEYGAAGPLVFIGFSQGASMAYRAAAAMLECRGVVALGGDVPPDVAPVAPQLPPVLIGRGTRDTWYTAEKAAADVAVLKKAGTDVAEFVFDGGHEWGAAFIDEARRFLDARFA